MISTVITMAILDYGKRPIAYENTFISYQWEGRIQRFIINLLRHALCRKDIPVVQVCSEGGKKNYLKTSCITSQCSF